MTMPDQPWVGAPVVVELLVVLLSYAVLFAVAELVGRRGVPPDTTRRWVHVVGSLLAIPVPLLLGRPLGIVLAVSLAAAQAWSRRHHALMSVHGVARRTYGEVALPLGIALVALVATTYGAYVFGVLVLGLADAAAGIVGQRFGTPIPHWPTDKSVVGSVAFLVVTVALATGFALGLPAAELRPLALLASGLVVTVAEALLGRGLDNLVIPTVAALSYGWLFTT